MYRVTKVIDFVCGHRLLDYGGRSKAIHGHSGRFGVTLEGETLDETGFLREIGEVKQTVKEWIDANFDHVMMMRKDDPFLSPLKKHDEPVFEMNENSTTENLCKVIFDYAADLGGSWSSRSDCGRSRPPVGPIVDRIGGPSGIPGSFEKPREVTILFVWKETLLELKAMWRRGFSPGLIRQNAVMRKPKPPRHTRRGGACPERSQRGFPPTY